MKTRYSSNRELAHIWANNDDSSVYKTANSISCQFDRLYSYNTCIAEIVGDTAILNTHSYSNTTSKHQSLAVGAIHGKKLIRLDISNYNLRTLVFGQSDFNSVISEPNHRRIADLLVKADRARLNGDSYRAQAFYISENLKAYANLLGLTYEPLDLDIYKEQAIKADKARKELEKIRKAEKIKEQAENLAKWRNGEDIRANFETTALRIKGDEIETSKGARIPLDHALRAYPLLKRLYNRETIPNLENHAIKLGNYTVNRLENETLIVGCHRIPFSEITAIANKLGV